MEMIAPEDSYADRRQLFKDIWDTAMLMEDKEPDILNKPKVIKTLRLNDDNKYIIGKKKKERIKNLRTVCNKILEYCNRQDADELFEEQIGILNPVRHNLKLKPKKLKTHRKKKKVSQTKSLHIPTANTTLEQNPVTAIKPTISDRKDNAPNKPGFKYNKTSIIRRTLVTNYNVKGKSITEGASGKSHNKTKTMRRKIIKKKRSKGKKKEPSATDLIEEYEKLENAHFNAEEMEFIANSPGP